MKILLQMNSLLQFTTLPQQLPEKIPAEIRKTDFKEIYKRFAAQEAHDQASRCSQCGVPFCQIHCPLGNNIPDWLKMVAQDRLEEAYQISSATNNFPEICGRICPQDRLCEGNCVIENNFESVTIGAIEKYITETAFDMGWVKAQAPKQENGFSVGIIGAGPAGLAAAEQLRAKGYEVHIYDRYDRMGGLLIYGIPNFKLEKNVVERRRMLLEEAGIHFHLGFEVGKDASLSELKSRHDAVLIATGVYKAREMQVMDKALTGITPALAYLTASNKTGLGDTVADYDNGILNASGKNVVVIGGGDTAMDCVRTAIRQGANSVKCLYRRDKVNMPGSQREVKNAEEEGAQFIWLSAPKAYAGNVKLEKILAVKMRIGVPDNLGRSLPVEIADSTFEIAADMVIEALGFEAENIPALFDAALLMVSKQGTLSINSQFMTPVEGVFAAGDIVRGASLVVWAIRDGRDASEAMDKWITSR